MSQTYAVIRGIADLAERSAVAVAGVCVCIRVCIRAYVRLISVSRAEMKRPGRCQALINLVAGAGFEPTTFGL